MSVQRHLFPQFTTLVAIPDQSILVEMELSGQEMSSCRRACGMMLGQIRGLRYVGGAEAEYEEQDTGEGQATRKDRCNRKTLNIIKESCCHQPLGKYSG